MRPQMKKTDGGGGELMELCLPSGYDKLHKEGRFQEDMWSLSLLPVPPTISPLSGEELITAPQPRPEARHCG